MVQTAIVDQPISTAELVSLAAVDYRLYCKTFFPNTFRDDFPDFADMLWDAAESRHTEFVNELIFRGGTKTTTSRAIASKRIAYAISRTIMLIAASAEKAEKTIRWLRKAVERNRIWADTFGLKPGSKWTDTEIEIVHTIAGHTISVIAFGITGNVRGVNIDDYRPDFIIIDDVVGDENSATSEQREKIETLILGAVANTLAPRSEAPDSKMLMLSTPQHQEDAAMKAVADPTWFTVRQPCWTAETAHLPIDFQVSAWETRFPTEGLRAKKRGHLARNRGSVFAREMEVRIATKETADFDASWLRYYDESSRPPLHQMYVIISIDPVPPPSPIAVQKGKYNTDFEAISAVGHYQGSYYLLEYRLNRGHNPSWTIANFFELVRTYRAKALVVETVAYQRTLAWLLRTAMQSQRIYLPVYENNDRRAKPTKIVDALQGPAQHGKLVIAAHMAEFISQFTDYPNVSHEDLLDSVAQAVTALTTVALNEESEGLDELSSQEIEFIGGCP